MTVQELSVMISVGVKPIIFVLNNKGYTIERAMHGESKKYDDITDWYSTFSLFVVMLLNPIQELDDAPRDIWRDQRRDITIVYRTH